MYAKSVSVCGRSIDEEDEFGYSIAYLDDQQALVSSHKGRLLLLDLETMSLRHELAIQNH